MPQEVAVEHEVADNAETLPAKAGNETFQLRDVQAA